MFRFKKKKIHLAQNMHTHLTRLGFSNRYKCDPNIALKAKMIIAISFVSLNKTDEYLDDLETELPQVLQGLLNWFEDTHVGR